MIKEWIHDQINIAHDNALSRRVYTDNPYSDITQKLKEEVIEFQQASIQNRTSDLWGFVGCKMVGDEVQAFEEHVKDSRGDELADIIIVALAGAKELGIDIISHIELKNKYNSLRIDK